jgi:glycosyltransferase involved in cell wall biosynthesis
MRVGVDVQLVADGNRSGLYNCLRNVIAELRLLLGDELWLIAEALGPRSSLRERRRELVLALDRAPVRYIRRPPRFYRAWRRFSAPNRVDVLLHNLHGLLPPASRGANAYLVPDVIPLVVDYGGQGADDYRPFYDTAVKHADVILVFSEHTKRDLLRRVGGSADLIRVAPLAAGKEFQPVIDKERLRSALAPHGLQDTPYVLMVATIEARKNHAVLLKAFARMVRHDPSLPHRLVLVGGKWVGHEAVFDSIRQLGLEDRVLYLGFVDSLPLLYAGAAAFVFPSLYEGFGLPPLEAMASGVPVLVANATSLPEVVADAGILFDPQDDLRLSSALYRVLTDPQHWSDLAARGLRRAAEFSWAKTAALYLDAFEFAHRRFRNR